ncbi:glycoprotein [Bordetella sp. J329]|nr:glycoprotein [Bordetella sp. J329]
MQSGLGGQSGPQGAEFVSRHIIYTEDRRPKRLDLIQFDGSDGWEEIRDRTEWDMSPFGDTPDVKLVT